MSMVRRHQFFVIFLSTTTFISYGAEQQQFSFTRVNDLLNKSGFSYLTKGPFAQDISERNVSFGDVQKFADKAFNYHLDQLSEANVPRSMIDTQGSMVSTEKQRLLKLIFAQNR